MSADSIPVARTPEGDRSGAFPEPVLAGCTDALLTGAPDMRGVWKVTEVLVDGRSIAEHRMRGAIQRLERCADRVAITTGGIIHHMRCEGTEEHGVNDVIEFDEQTPITVVATFEQSVHVLRPVGLPTEVERWRDGDDLMRQYVGFT